MSKPTLRMSGFTPVADFATYEEATDFRSSLIRQTYSPGVIYIHKGRYCVSIEGCSMSDFRCLFDDFSR